jgi:exopolysaccharide biosynthesis polyprenyl glycosylphosphotransferase
MVDHSLRLSGQDMSAEWPGCVRCDPRPTKWGGHVQQEAVTPAGTISSVGPLLAVNKVSTGIPAVRRHHYVLYGTMAVSDAVCVVTALLLAYQFRFAVLRPSPDYLVVLALAPLATVAIYLCFGLYRIHQFSSAEEFRRIILAVSALIGAIVMCSFWSSASTSRLWIFCAWLLAVTFTASTRRMWHRRIRRYWAVGRLTFDTLIVGTNHEAQHLAERLSTSKLGYRPLGFVSTGPDDTTVLNGLPILGSIGGLRQFIHWSSASCVFVAATAVRPEDIKHVLKARRLDGVEIRVTANFPAVLSATRFTPQAIDGLIALSVNAVRLTRSQAIAKRTFDLVVSILALLALSPVLAAIALAIKLTTPGPALFRQQRVGLQRRPFMVIKFRTMVTGAELMLTDLASRNEADGPLFKVRGDPRVTLIGRWLRRYSLDELPQLWNVLRGEMSLVGPRPPLPREVEAYEEWQLGRLEVRPGITGLWQVSGRSDLSFDEYVRLDLFYVENWSLAYDLFILLKTIPMLLSPRGAY